MYGGFIYVGINGYEWILSDTLVSAKTEFLNSSIDHIRPVIISAENRKNITLANLWRLEDKGGAYMRSSLAGGKLNMDRKMAKRR